MKTIIINIQSLGGVTPKTATPEKRKEVEQLINKTLSKVISSAEIPEDLSCTDRMYRKAQIVSMLKVLTESYPQPVENRNLTKGRTQLLSLPQKLYRLLLREVIQQTYLRANRTPPDATEIEKNLQDSEVFRVASQILNLHLLAESSFS